MDHVVRLRRDERLHRLVDHLGEVLLGENAAGHGLVEGLAIEQFHHDEKPCSSWPTSNTVTMFG